VWTTSPFAYAASAQGLSIPLDPAVITNYDKLTAVGRPDDGSQNWVALYTYTLPLLYRADLITFPETGITWDELWDPKYEGQLTLNLDPNLLVFPIAELMGINLETDDVTPVFDRIAELKPNIGAIVPNDTALIEAIQSGEVSMGLAIIGDGLALQDAGVDIAWIVPSPGVSLSSDSLYIPQGVPDNVAYWAQVFINEVIAAENQTEFCAVVAVVPTNGEASPADYMQGDPAFPFTDEELEQYAIPVPNKIAAENLDEWTERFTVALQG
jgi:spermidine/putrescine-binding protein